MADAIVEVDGPLANSAGEAALVIRAVAHSHLFGLENLRDDIAHHMSKLDFLGTVISF